MTTDQIRFNIPLTLKIIIALSSKHDINDICTGYIFQKFLGLPSFTVFVLVFVCD